MKIVIAGAGAMGGRFGHMLKTAGEEVIFIDGWKDHVDAINNRGLTVNANGTVENVPFTAYHTSNISDDVPADLIVLFVKAMQLPNMMENLKPIIGENTRVVCLLNGLGHIEVIAKFIAEKNIFVGTTMWTAGMDGPGHIHYAGDGGIELQNFDPNEEKFAQTIVGTFNQAGLKARYSSDVIASIWKKACVNGVLNSSCALLDCNLNQFGNTNSSHDFVVQIVAEFAAVAKELNNVELDQQSTIELIEKAYDPETQGKHYPSMHQDLVKNKRLTEIDYINGFVAQKGKEKGIKVPYCELMTFLVHGKEHILGAA